MSIPPPNRGTSKKRDREASDDEGHDREKKGKAVQPETPDSPGEDALTRWNSQLLPRSASSSQDDIAGEMADIRRAVVRYLQNQVHAATHRFDQSKLAWVGLGKCVPICMEYIHRRRAGATPADIVRHLNEESAQARLTMTNEVYNKSHSQAYAMQDAKNNWPRKDHLYLASLVLELPTRAERQLERPFAALDQALKSGHHTPANITPKSLRLVHTLRGPLDFSLETLVAIWPAGRPKMPELAPYRSVIKVPAVASASRQNSSSSSSAAVSLQGTSAPLSIIEADFRAYEKQCAGIRHFLLSRPKEPYLHVNMRVPARNGGHAIVLDFSRDSAGIFDPNIGFISLGLAPTVNDAFWLLSLFFVGYDANIVNFYSPK